MTTNIDTNRYYAICSIIQFYRRSQGGQYISIENMAKSINIEPIILNRYINGSSINRHEAAIEKIEVFFKLWISEQKDKHTVPKYIKDAARFLFKIEAHSDIDELFAEMADRRPKTIRSFTRTHVGIYDVWRYGAHDDANFNPGTTAGGKKFNWIVRGSMQIIGSHVDDKQSQREENDELPSPRFNIRYRNAKRTKRTVYPSNLDISSSDGLISVIGGHLYFVGHEHNSHYPMLIITHYDFQVGHRFKGLILRNNQNRNSVFCSRVWFIKNDKVKSFNELDKYIGIYRDIDVKSETKEFIDSLRNEANNGGYGGLML